MSFDSLEHNIEAHCVADNTAAQPASQLSNKGRRRHKVATSCNRCRQNKRKCDSGVPCSNCKRVGAECRYTDAQQSRALWGDALLSPEKVLGVVSSSPSTTTTSRSSDRASSPASSPSSSRSSSPAHYSIGGSSPSPPPNLPDRRNRCHKRDRAFSFSAASNSTSGHSSFHPFHHQHHHSHSYSHQQQDSSHLHDHTSRQSRSQSMVIEPLSPVQQWRLSLQSPAVEAKSGLLLHEDGGAAVMTSTSAPPAASFWSSSTLTHMPHPTPLVVHPLARSARTFAVGSSSVEQQSPSLHSKTSSTATMYAQPQQSPKTPNHHSLCLPPSPVADQLEIITHVASIVTPSVQVETSPMVGTPLSTTSSLGSLTESTMNLFAETTDRILKHEGDDCLRAVTTLLDDEFSSLETLLWHDTDLLPAEMVSTSPLVDNNNWPAIYIAPQPHVYTSSEAESLLY